MRRQTSSVRILFCLASGMPLSIVAGDVYERAGRFERMIKRYRTFTFVFNSLNPACEWLGGNAKYVERILE
jgi:hypothetical protein